MSRSFKFAGRSLDSESFKSLTWGGYEDGRGWVEITLFTGEKLHEDVPSRDAAERRWGAVINEIG